MQAGISVPVTRPASRAAPERDQLDRQARELAPRKGPQGPPPPSVGAAGRPSRAPPASAAAPAPPRPRPPPPIPAAAARRPHPIADGRRRDLIVVPGPDGRPGKGPAT